MQITDLAGVTLFILAIYIQRNSPELAAVMVNIPIKNAALLINSTLGGDDLTPIVSTVWLIVTINMIAITAFYAVWRLW